MGRRVSRWAGIARDGDARRRVYGGSEFASRPRRPRRPRHPVGRRPAYRLRATTTQSIPPINRFGMLPMVTITGDNRVVVAGPQIMIYPGPFSRTCRLGRSPTTVSRRSWIAARQLGMLSGSGDFVPSDMMPGASLGRIEIVVDGVLHDLTGDPSRVMVCVTTPCDPAPGTPEAFGAFWASLSDLTWLAGDLGQEAPYVADSYALLIGVEPADGPAHPARGGDLAAQAKPIATLGKPVGSAPTPRCGTVRGRGRHDPPAEPRGGEPADALGRRGRRPGQMRRPSRPARWCPARMSASGLRAVGVAAGPTRCTLTAE